MRSSAQVMAIGALAVVVIAWLLLRSPAAPTPAEPTPPSAVRAGDPLTGTRASPGEGVPADGKDAVRVPGVVYTFSRDRTPIHDAWIRAWPVNMAEDRTGPLAGEARTDERGEFLLKLPAAGRYGVLVLAPGHAMEASMVRTPARRLEFGLRRAVPADVRVVGSDGRPVAESFVLRRAYGLPEAVEYACDSEGLATLEWNTFDEIGARAPGLGVLFNRRRPPKAGPLVLRLRPARGLAGRVIDESDAPVVGARVHVDHDGPGPRQVRTDERGEFEFDGVMEIVHVRLHVAADGFATHRREVGLDDRAIEITLRRPITLTGRVVDAVGKPAVGAGVEVVSRGYRHGAKSGTNGSFRIEGIEPPFVAAELELSSKDRSIQIRVPGPFDPSLPLELVLDPTRMSWVRLKLVDSEGRPLGGISCRAGRLARTDGDGLACIKVDRAPGSQVRVRFSRGRQDWHRSLVTRAHPDGPPDLVTGPEMIVLRVIAIDAEDREVAGAEVTVRESEHGTPLTPILPGTFRVEEGRHHHVEVSASGCVAERCILVPEPETHVLRVRLARGARVRGRTKPGLVLYANGARVGEAGDDGSFDVMVPIGPVFLVARDQSFLNHGMAKLSLAADDVRDLGALPPTGERLVVGSVVDEAGRPLSGVSLLFSCAVPGEPGRMGATKADGAFRFQVPAIAEWLLLATKKGRAPDYRVVSVGKEVEPIRLTCRRGGADLRVRVRGGVKADFYTVRLRLPRSPLLLRWPLRRDWKDGADRIAEFEGLPPGSLEVVFTAKTQTAHEVTLVEGRVARLELSMTR